MRPGKHRIGNARLGVLALVILLPILYLAFTKAIPFTHGYQIHAIFPTAVNISPKSPVRIAGVEVGKVTNVESYGDGTEAAKVTMELQDKALPIHKDATMKIRPRLFLEGNFFVDLKPGSPSAGDLGEGGTIPITQTSDPVQIDQLLSALQANTRKSLQELLVGYGTALTEKPTKAQDLDQDPVVRGLTGAEGLNNAYRVGGPALKGTAIVNQALQGRTRDDLPKLVKAVGQATSELGANEASLRDFIIGLDGTLGAFASRSTDLSAALSILPATLTSTRSAFQSITAAMPSLRTFAKGFTEVAEELPDTYEATEPWFTAVEQLMAPDRLGGIAKDLKTMGPDLDALVVGQQGLTPLIDDSAVCGNNVVLPTFEKKLDDGSLSTGQPNYQELWHGLVGLAGSGQNFDGNGAFSHLFGAGGNTIIRTDSSRDPYPPKNSDEKRVLSIAGGRAVEPPKASSPAYPGGGKVPAYKPNVPCRTQAQPDVNGPLSQGKPDAVVGG